MSSSLSSMPLEEFAGYVDALIERSLNGEILPREEVVSLLELDPQSPHVALLAEKAKAMSHMLTDGQGRVWSALGVDRCPCTMSCSFCSLGEKWGIVKDHSEWSEEDVLETARRSAEAGASWFVLRTTEFYGLERLAALAAKVRAVMPESCSLVVNTGEIDERTSALLTKAGVCGVYHTLRLREGVDTRFDPKERLATLAAIRDSSLKLYHLAEPLGAEHSSEEIADRIFVGHEFAAVMGGVMARITVKGLPLENAPAASEERIAQVTAVCRIFGGRRTPDVCTIPASKRALESGANVVTIEVGAIPRSADVEHSTAWKGFGMEDAKALLRSAGYKA